MDGNTGTGLRHVPRGGALLGPSTRSSLIARGRFEAAALPGNTHYNAGATHYTASRYSDAAASFLLAAEQGHAESQYLLSVMLDEGTGIPPDKGRAAHWEHCAATQGHAYAQANASFRCYSAGDLHGAFDWCRRSADNRLPWAQFHLGLMYRKGEGVARSDAEAAHWYRLAAEQQHPESAAKLAELYSLGQGVAQSDAAAASWYHRAAESGHAEAQFQLGHLYAVGQGVELDYVQSRHWIREAARQGHPAATAELKRREYRDA